MSAGRICVREIDVADPGESVESAARQMRDRNVGTLVVLNEKQEPVGIVTDRDLAVRVVADSLDGKQTPVSEVMTKSPRAVSEETPIEEALALMRAGPYRRVPVVDQAGKLVGLLSLDDILDLLTEEFNLIGSLIQTESPSRKGR